MKCLLKNLVLSMIQLILMNVATYGCGPDHASGSGSRPQQWLYELSNYTLPEAFTNALSAQLLLKYEFSAIIHQEAGTRGSLLKKMNLVIGRLKPGETFYIHLSKNNNNEYLVTVGVRIGAVRDKREQMKIDLRKTHALREQMEKQNGTDPLEVVIAWMLSRSFPNQKSRQALLKLIAHKFENPVVIDLKVDESDEQAPIHEPDIQSDDIDGLDNLPSIQLLAEALQDLNDGDSQDEDSQ